MQKESSSCFHHHFCLVVFFSTCVISLFRERFSKLYVNKQLSSTVNGAVKLFVLSTLQIFMIIFIPPSKLTVAILYLVVLVKLTYTLLSHAVEVDTDNVPELVGELFPLATPSNTHSGPKLLICVSYYNLLVWDLKWSNIS